MFRRIVLLALSVLALACIAGARLQAQQNAPQGQTEPRIAFVVGNAAYAPGMLPTALNDAGLVAEALRSIGFEIVEGADLSQADLVRTYREFLAKVEASGPDTLAFVYFSGHALSFEGENFLLGVDARLARESDIPIEAVRLSDLVRPLADSPARAKVMMIDAVRPLPFRPEGKALARGLEAVDPPQGMLIAYASAPGTVAPDRPVNYGAYATAIAEMLRSPGADLDTAFTHIRSRTHLTTEGQQTPWHASALGEQIELVPPEAATASVPAPPPIRQARPMREIGPDEAYALAIEMDTLEGYTGFVQAYPGHPYAKRVWAMIRARREALAWMRANEINTPQAYWTYLRRYPNGMYAFDAERRLRRLGAAGGPPPGFAMMEFDDVPMALSGEPVEYEEVYRVGPPPPRGLYGAPRPAYLANMPPPQRRGGGGGGSAASRILPALAIAIPLVAALAPAPRNAVAPGGAGGGGATGNRQGGGRGNRAAAPAVAPVSVTPNAAIAPSNVAPSTLAPSTVTPNTAAPTTPGGSRPPGWGPGGARPPGAAGRPPGSGGPATANAPAAVAPNSAAPNSATPVPGSPGSGRPPGRPPGPPPGIANRTPPAAAPPAAAPPNSAAPSTPPAPAAGRPPGRPPGPPPGIANRTPPSAAPPSAPPARPPGPPPEVRRPPPPSPPPAVAARPPAAAPAPPPPRPAAPPPPRPPVAAAARPAPPAPPPPKPAAPPPKPPACPAGKTLKVVNGAPTCA